MKNGNPKIRLIRLLVIGSLVVGAGLTVRYLLNRPTFLTIEEVLWVKTGGGFHPPGSAASSALIDLLHPDYMNFDEMTFTGPVILLFDGADPLDEQSSSESPLILAPHHP